MSETPKLILVFLITLSLFYSFSVPRGAEAFSTELRVSSAGKALARMLDSMRVEDLWLAGHHIDWRTGLPDGRPYVHKGAHTHCSAFVAAVAYRLGIYILRPPSHPQTLLANAQVDWLNTEGRSFGWRKVESAQRAQEHANEGFLVVAAYKNPNPEKSGHIAVVRPYAKGEEALREEGPQVIQAATNNLSSTTLRRGFRYHRGAFEDGKIVFFAHAVNLARLHKSLSVREEARKPNLQ
jgi:hypothetical protein